MSGDMSSNREISMGGLLLGIDPAPVLWLVAAFGEGAYACYGPFASPEAAETMLAQARRGQPDMPWGLYPLPSGITPERTDPLALLLAGLATTIITAASDPYCHIPSKVRHAAYTALNVACAELGQR